MRQVVRSKYIAWIKPVTYIVVGILLVALLLRQRHALGQAIDVVRSAELGWLSIGVIAMGTTLPASALVYRALSPRRLQFWRTTIVLLAGFCVNKVLPSGSGAAGTSYLYLRANKLQRVQASAVVALNSLLGLLGHMLLLTLLLVVQPHSLDTLKLTPSRFAPIIIAGAILMGSVGILCYVFRSKISNFIRPLKQLVSRPRNLVGALSASMLITLSYVVSLYAAAQAVGVHVTLAGAMIALSASVIATTVVPTPGGIGAAEAGVYGGLIALSTDRQGALAVALLYRICTFWIPLLIGSVAFAVVAKRGYLHSARR